MTRRRRVDDRDVHAVAHDVLYAADQRPRVEHDRLARLQVDFCAVLVLKPLDDPDQPVAVVVLARDVVTPAQIDPLAPLEQAAELRLERVHRRGEIVRILLAEGVHVHAVQHLGDVFGQFVRCRPQPRKVAARVVDAVPSLGGKLGVEPQADLLSGRLCSRQKFSRLCRRIEDYVIDIPHQFVPLFFVVGRRKDVRLAAETRLAEARFVKPACGRAVQVARYQRIGAKSGIRLLGEQYLAARRLAYSAQYLQVADERRLVYLEIGRAHHSTKSGCSSTCHGKPFLFSSSMYGSGSNSSHVNTPSLSHLPVSSILAPIIAGTPVV